MAKKGGRFDIVKKNEVETLKKKNRGEKWPKKKGGDSQALKSGKPVIEKTTVEPKKNGVGADLCAKGGTFFHLMGGERLVSQFLWGKRVKKKRTGEKLGRYRLLECKGSQNKRCEGGVCEKKKKVLRLGKGESFCADESPRGKGGPLQKKKGGSSPTKKIGHPEQALSEEQGK